ncbi:MAG TPA: DUF1735 domain-containing protein [Candidatus Alistipes cottocaccae]|nr:DUF1735 domain-containing protein [Candidatus Alistipes cottocaccae]
MKTNHKIFRMIGKMLLAVTVLAGFTACETDPVEQKGGKLPDKEGIENVYGILRCSGSCENIVDMILTEGNGFLVNGVYFEQTKPVSENVSIQLQIDESVIEAYNTLTGEERTLLPESNYEFMEGNTLEISANGKQSALKQIKFLAEGLAAGEYVLPVSIGEQGNALRDNVIYFNITIREPFVGEYPLDQEEFYPEEGENGAKEPIFMVFYVNTKDYDPRLVTDFYMRKRQRRPPVDVWTRAVGNIVNLRTVVLKYDEASGRALLDLGSDMTHVLSHASTYIWPIQETERKVCLSLEGGGTGLGFCNLTDEQIADFVAQVKTVVETYNLDGINLWDRNSGYGKEGMPEMNTTSYPKLIKAMREALGSDKLLTVTDYEEPTEYFWDTEATGGIEVGQYLDYAWSGYCNDGEIPQICDPWHPDDVEVSKYTHKPFAGLDPAKYGCINFAWYKFSDPVELKDAMNVYRWRAAGNKQSQILVFKDLMTILQNEYESTGQSYGGICLNFADDGRNGTGLLNYNNNYTNVTSNLMYLPDGTSGYGKWLKDW